MHLKWNNDVGPVLPHFKLITPGRDIKPFRPPVCINPLVPQTIHPLLIIWDTKKGKLSKLGYFMIHLNNLKRKLILLLLSVSEKTSLKIYKSSLCYSSWDCQSQNVGPEK